MSQLLWIRTYDLVISMTRITSNFLHTILQGKYLLAEVITEVFIVIKLENFVSKPLLQHPFMVADVLLEMIIELHHN